MTTDEQLMLDVQRGVREAFEQLFEPLRSAILGRPVLTLVRWSRRRIAA